MVVGSGPLFAIYNFHIPHPQLLPHRIGPGLAWPVPGRVTNERQDNNKDFA